MGRDTLEPLRTCTSCGLEARTEEELEVFKKNNTCKHGRVSFCKTCDKIRSRKIPRDDSFEGRIYRRRNQLKRDYGVSPETYIKNMNTANQCEICGSLEILCYDHCHDTMNFRGVLCSKCNTGLGYFGDNLEGLQKAVDYLSKTKYTIGITTKEIT